MIAIKNLTNSPYDLQGIGGTIHLPALGEAVGEFESGYLDVLKASGAVQVADAIASRPRGRPRKIDVNDTGEY